MRLVHSPAELQRLASEALVSGTIVGVVPTMGALHEGHLSLVRAARDECDLVIVTVFVNPTQFGPSEDLDKYPRSLEQDAILSEAAGADVVFAPSAADMYPAEFQNYVETGPLAERLCGASRPGHFRGVATVVLKLLNVTRAARAYFGEKDYQQLRVIQQMASDFNLPVEVVPVPTVREADGLAMSSRNRYLSADERKAALVLNQSLDLAAESWARGERGPEALGEGVRGVIESEPLARVDYVEVVDPVTLLPAAEGSTRVLIALAVVIGATRLIDNRLLA
jgi:pantoate--beta-alanine ligase